MLVFILDRLRAHPSNLIPGGVDLRRGIGEREGHRLELSEGSSELAAAARMVAAEFHQPAPSTYEPSGDNEVRDCQ